MYQASRLKTQRWHDLDSVVDAVREVGGVKYHHARLFESSHKDFKVTYEKIFKRASTTIATAIKKKEYKYAI